MKLVKIVLPCIISTTFLQRTLEMMANALLNALARSSVPTSATPATTPVLTHGPTTPAHTSTASPLPAYTSRVNNSLKRYDKRSIGSV